MSKLNKFFLLCCTIGVALGSFMVEAKPPSKPIPASKAQAASRKNAKAKGALKGTTVKVATGSGIIPPLASPTKTAVVASIEGTSQVVETEKDHGFPTVKLYTLKICLDPRYKQKPFKDSRPEILGTTQAHSIRIMSDYCVSWNENLGYYYTAPARYISFDRTLVIHKGTTSERIPFQYALNPWMHGETNIFNEVADFIRVNPSQTIAASMAMGALMGQDLQDRGATIVANDARVNFQELGLSQKTGGQFTFDFRTSPQIEILNQGGHPVFVKLNSGEFDFQAYLVSNLIENNKPVRRIVNTQELKGIATVKDGVLTYIQDIDLEAMPARGRMELAIVLKPREQTAYLQTLKAIYSLGDHVELKHNLYARIKPGFTNSNPTFNFDSYINLNQPKNSTLPFGTFKDGLRKLKYEFEPMFIRLTRIGKETATEREVFYQVKACIKNGIDNAAIRGYHFKISKANTNVANASTMEPTVRVSEYDSCIYWDDRIVHKVYAPQKYFKSEYRIQNEELGLDDTLIGYINPWYMILSRDSRTFEASEIEKFNQNELKRAWFFIPNYKARLNRVTYNADKLLNLGVTKHVSLILEPQIINYSSITSGIESREPIRDGLWKLRWAVLRNPSESDTNTNRLIDHGEALVVATQGRIITPLQIKYRDFRWIDSRNSLMLEIAPVHPEYITVDADDGLKHKTPLRDLESTVDETAGIAPQTFIGPYISGGEEESSGYLVPYPFNPTLTTFMGIPNAASTNFKDQGYIDQAPPAWDQLPKLVERQKQTTDDLYQMIRGYEKSNFIRTWNLSEPADRMEIRRYLSPSPEVLKNFSPSYNRPLFMTDMLDKVLETKTMTGEMNERLCFFFFDRNPVKNPQFKVKLLPWKLSDYWLKRCLNSARNERNPFFLSQLETIIDRITDIQDNGIVTSNITVGAGFNLSNSDSLALSKTLSGSVSFGIDSKKITKLFAIGATTSYSLARSNSSTESAANSLGISAGATMNVRKLPVQLTGTFKERCLTVSLNPNLYAEKDTNFYRDVKAAIPAAMEQNEYLTQKMRLCHSTDKNMAFKARETYYFVTQDLLNSAYTDNPNLKNRPLLLQLRGTNAYENFLRFASAQLNIPKTGTNLDSANLLLDENMQSTLRLSAPMVPGILIEPLTLK